MTDEKPVCGICGEPMPEGEEMFNYHGYSGPCPKPPLPAPTSIISESGAASLGLLVSILDACWLEINALGGNPTNELERALNDQIGVVLDIIEKHGARDPGERRRLAELTPSNADYKE